MRSHARWLESYSATLALTRRNVPAPFCLNPSPQCVDRTLPWWRPLASRLAAFVSSLMWNNSMRADCCNDQTDLRRASSSHEAWIINKDKDDMAWWGMLCQLMADDQMLFTCRPDVMGCYCGNALWKLAANLLPPPKPNVILELALFSSEQGLIYYCSTSLAWMLTANQWSLRGKWTWLFSASHKCVCMVLCLLEANDRSFHTGPQALPPHSMPELALLVGSLPALLQRLGQVSGPAQTRSISPGVSPPLHPMAGAFHHPCRHLYIDICRCVCWA